MEHMSWMIYLLGIIKMSWMLQVVVIYPLCIIKVWKLDTSWDYSLNPVYGKILLMVTNTRVNV